MPIKVSVSDVRDLGGRLQRIGVAYGLFRVVPTTYTPLGSVTKLPQASMLSTTYACGWKS